MRPFATILLGGLTGLLLLCLLPVYQVGGQEKAAKKTPFVWTLQEAVAQLDLHPRDSYLQYVLLQLARRENMQGEVGSLVERAIFGEGEGKQHPDLFQLFGNPWTMQQVLQLETMRDAGPGVFRGIPAGAVAFRAEMVVIAERLGPDPARLAAAAAVDAAATPPLAGFPAAVPWNSVLLRADWEGMQMLLARTAEEKEAVKQKADFEKRRKERVKVASLAGPEFKGRPWKTLLAGRNPEVSRLSLYVPEDFYLVEFKSLSKMLDCLDTAGQWATYLNLQAERDARTLDVGARLRRQLALDGDDTLRPFYDLAIEETAVTGSDPFVREGSDVTVLFRVTQPQLFRAQMDRSLADARKGRAGVTEKKGKLLDFDYVHLATPDRSLCVWSVYPEPGLHVRSNSEAALRRVLEAVHGKYPDGKPVPRLGASDELKYVRTLLPRAAKEEDGFVYLSQPFLKHLFGPRLKLIERRRRITYNHLRMIGHAAQLYRTEHGKAPRSLQALAKADCCPGKFNEAELACPFGGKYRLSADGLAGICTHCGTAEFLTPCCESPLEEVNGLEAEAYKAYAPGDPGWGDVLATVAARVQVTAKRCRVQTLLLPFNDEIRTELAKLCKGPPEPLDTLPVPKRNLFSASVRVPKDDIVKSLREMLQEQVHSQQTSVVAALMDCFLSDPYGLAPAGAPWRALAPLEEGAQAHVLHKVAKAVQSPRKRGKTVADVLDCFLAPPGAIGPAAIPWRLLAPLEEGAVLTVSATGNESIRVTRVPLEGDGRSRRLTREETLQRDFWALARDAERLLNKGLGNQAGLHVYDASINFDFSLENVLSDLLGVLNGGRLGKAQQLVNEETVYMGLAASALVAPGYVSFPVRDAAIVDDFLAKTDKLLVLLARQRQGGGALQIEQEYYKINGQGKGQTRSYGVRVGPVRLRLFWARIGDGLYIANQASVLNDLRTAHAARAKVPGKEEDGPVGHAMIRLRPRNWDQALTGFRLAWAENNREACLHNLGPLSSGARAYCAGAKVQGPGLSWDSRADEARRYAERLHGLGFCCPEGGRYALAKDGKAVTCSVHGAALDPRQPEAPAKGSPLDRLMRDFADLSVTLSCERESVQAVLVIERR